MNANGSLSAQQNIDAGVSGFRYSEALNEIEGILIEIVEPKLNKQSGKLRTARRYYQHIDERLAETTSGDLMLELQQIKKKLGSLIHSSRRRFAARLNSGVMQQEGE